MQMKIFIRTFSSAVDAQMFNSVLNTKWPELIKPMTGARFRILYSEVLQTFLRLYGSSLTTRHKKK